MATLAVTLFKAFLRFSLNLSASSRILKQEEHLFLILERLCQFSAHDLSGDLQDLQPKMLDVRSGAE